MGGLCCEKMRCFSLSANLDQWDFARIIPCLSTQLTQLHLWYFKNFFLAQGPDVFAAHHSCSSGCNNTSFFSWSLRVEGYLCKSLHGLVKIWVHRLSFTSLRKQRTSNRHHRICSSIFRINKNIYILEKYFIYTMMVTMKDVYMNNNLMMAVKQVMPT